MKPRPFTARQVCRIKAKQRQRESLPVELFEQSWRIARGPELEREVRFHDVRGWRFDYAHRASMVAVEIDGGIMQGGRHNRGVRSTLNVRGERVRHGYLADCEKLNAAAAEGWRVFRLAGDMVDDEQQIKMIMGAINGAKRIQ